MAADALCVGAGSATPRAISNKFCAKNAGATWGQMGGWEDRLALFLLCYSLPVGGGGMMRGKLLAGMCGVMGY